VKVPVAIERLLALVRKRRLERELDGEVRAHLELAEREAIAAGLPAEEARLAARRAFGGIEQMKEEHRDRRGVRWIETTLRDFRCGVASLIRDPGFALVAIGVLALGIGANVAMFSVVDAVLLKPLPFPEPERIVRIWEAPRPGVTNSTSTLDFLDWKRLGTVFEAMSAEQWTSMALTGKGEPARLSGRLVTSDYFRVFKTQARLGRTFLPEEDQPGAEPVIVLSYAAWQNYFGADPDILERRPILDGEAHQVVGVLPPGAFDRGDAEFWKPLIFTPEQMLRDQHWLTLHGRLRGGVTLAQARAQMQSIDAALEDVEPVYKRDWTIVVEPYQRWLVGDGLRRSMFIAFGAVAMVLLIACANVANLLLAKGAGRRKELAVRAALGAGRGRLVAQLLTESLVLCLAGGAAGVALAALLIRAVTPFLWSAIPYTADVGVDWRALAFAGAVALGVALLVGTLPSLQTNFGRLSQALNQSARGSSGAHGRLRRVIVIGEVALSLVLVCGAVLLFRSLLRLQQLDTGIRSDNIITMSVALPLHDYPTPESAALFFDALTQRLEGEPGVEEASLTSHLPLRWIDNGEGLRLDGIDPMVNVRLKRVDPGYFHTLDIPLLAGRGITPRDGPAAPAALVLNEALAARLAELGGVASAVGRHAHISCPNYVTGGFTFREFEIVGVIRSERVSSPGNADPPVAYVSLAQVPRPDVRILVRTLAQPAAVMPAIREAVAQVDPNLPLGDIATMRRVREQTLSGATRPAWVIGVFAAVAALLAALGLYGVLAHAVTQQRREIGIRMALGARSRDVLGHVLGGAMRMVFVGLALGLVGAFALTRVIQNLLFEVSAMDPLALAVACLALALVGLLAGLVPASRAAGVEPMTVLRDEG
jgi:putative ABC transport system permease protein